MTAAEARAAVTAVGPGRVNLIGDHTDTTGGLVLPMAIDLATTVTGRTGGDAVILRSADEPEPAVVQLDVTDPSTLDPPWARYVAGVVAELRPRQGFVGEVSTTLPIGAGLSSSAALEVAVALALGFDGSPLALAAACQRAEQRASGVPCGIMDQLASAAGLVGHALLIDCHALTVEPVALPAGVEVVVVHSGEARALAGSAYAERRAACEAAEAVVGPLRLVHEPAALDRIEDPVLRRRARHVVGENARVRAFAGAL
ncbi:MAG: Galactokinase, partial [Acidimicrobiales bacterium]|nr:Galactokinase [Acidimicrobiales bacterium]